MSVQIDGFTLQAKDVVKVARGKQKASLAASSRENITQARNYINNNWLHDEAPLMYAFNTGVGLFKDQRILIKDMEAYQGLVIRAHATGIGEPFAQDVVRATMLLRANAFASNFSGPDITVVDRLLEFLNKGLHPVIPQKGSVGASGDLAPLAYLAGAVASFPETKVEYNGTVMPVREALPKANMPLEFVLGAKDASALINGSTVSLALGVLAAHDLRRILKAADIALCLSLEAMRGELVAFKPYIHNARPHKGQLKTARNVIKIAGDSKRCSEEARLTVYPEENRAVGVKPAPRVQDVYSLRCAPQVHGPVKDALDYIDGILHTEINSATDNPLLFEKEEGGYHIISGGNFHGAYVAQAMDLLAMTATDLGSISERRLARLIDPTLSYGLPRNLNNGKKGLNTGYGTVQCSMSALVMECRTLSMPASVDSISGKSNAEDHVSNSTWAGRKARTIVENVEQIVATEILMACQALSLIDGIASEHPIGKGSKAALDAVRKVIAPALDGDRWFHFELEQALELVRSGAIIDAVEMAVGELEV